MIARDVTLAGYIIIALAITLLLLGVAATVYALIRLSRCWQSRTFGARDAIIVALPLAFLGGAQVVALGIPTS